MTDLKKAIAAARPASERFQRTGLPQDAAAAAEELDGLLAALDAAPKTEPFGYVSTRNSFYKTRIDAVKNGEQYVVAIYAAPQPQHAAEREAEPQASAEYRATAKRNLRMMIKGGSADKALMLKCLEELS